MGTRAGKACDTADPRPPQEEEGQWSAAAAAAGPLGHEGEAGAGTAAHHVQATRGR
jgi:hypothetical protein